MTPVFGLLIVDKPAGMTSHDVVARVRRLASERRVGHAGTLDPMATGVLVLALGEATRILEYITTVRKTYEAEITLGVVTDTYDMEGEIVARHELSSTLTCETVGEALAHFTGDLQQMPPVYSAIKVDGKSAHARVRAGEEVELEPRPVTIHSNELVECKLPLVRFVTEVSSGTYIRSLAYDLGHYLGVGATLSGLRRSTVGGFTLDDAVSLGAFEQAAEAGRWHDLLLSPREAADWAAVLHLDQADLDHIRHGRPVPDENATDGIAPALAPDGTMVAVVEGVPEKGFWQPRKVFRKQIESAS